MGGSKIWYTISEMKHPTLVIHGGAIFAPSDYEASRYAEYKSFLQKALDTGYTILNKGGPALDAVEQAIWILEECGMFDAGRGAVYTYDGKQELDASIMDGSNLKAGAVAGVRTIKRPISAARSVMEHTWHVLLMGQGAEAFAKEQALEIVDPSYFHNSREWGRYVKLKAEADQKKQKKESRNHSTVGAVALDNHGNLAAGTSTGGLDLKLYGRVGDAPIIGAGTYANNQTCALSMTGEGEYFIRTSAAYQVHARMTFAGQSLAEASQNVLDEIKQMGGIGGMIGITSDGTVAMPYTSIDMFCGYKNSDSEEVRLFPKPSDSSQ